MPYMYKTEVTRGTYAANAGMWDLTAANAFFGGANVAAYQDGKHLLWASDGTNTLLARISATAPGGETLSGAELISNPELTADTMGYSVSDSAISRVDSSSDPGTDSTTAGAVNKFVLKVVANGVAAGWGVINFTIADIGKLYKLTGLFYAPSSNTAVNAAQLSASGRIGSPAATITTEDAWQTLTAYGTSVSTGADSAFRVKVNSTTLNDVVYGDKLSAQIVTSPATTGALLLANTGARGFISLSASFNGNLAGSYRIYTTKKYRSL